MTSDAMRCGVIGVGRMGRHHARVYAQLEGAELVGVVDRSEERRTAITDEWGGRPLSTVEELIDLGVDAVTIATPTIHHREAAEALLEAGVACLIEKPLAPTADEAMAIAETARRCETTLQVGHVVRFDPVMQAIKSLGPIHPRHVEVSRISPMTFRSLDVSVVLDMMIHDLDLLLMLVGSEPEDIQASGVPVLSDQIDVCNARLTFPAATEGFRTVANVTASRLALKTERKIRIISEDLYLSADFAGRSGTVVRKSSNESKLEEMQDRIRRGEDLSDVNYLDLVEFEELKVEDVEPLRLQAEDFLHNVRTGSRPSIDAEAGFAAVRTAERILESAHATGAIGV
ncbi:MAG: UDP-N-acetyl-D-glucosamine dehydrogenase [Phycisphaerae bacterium]|nr:UDP-N-acetyl-D-glucosamine dehydrogenase [Phycisphaerae bacterium]